LISVLRRGAALGIRQHGPPISSNAAQALEFWCSLDVSQSPMESTEPAGEHDGHDYDACPGCAPSTSTSSSRPTFQELPSRSRRHRRSYTRSRVAGSVGHTVGHNVEEPEFEGAETGVIPAASIVGAIGLEPTTPTVSK